MKYLPDIDSPYDVKKLNMTELDCLAGEIRQTIIETVRKNGGHLASNLGTVELTLALHKVFDSSSDKIIFDVGHQSYTHKLVTGRREQFHTLRKAGGLSGFPKREESAHDCFNTGHSSTSLSAAMGYVAGRDLQHDQYSVVAVIGDGAISGGMTFEALNNIGRINTQLIIILNDNEMSISKNVGALSDQLAKIRVSRRYIKFKENFKNALKNFPIFGKEIEHMLKKTRNVFKRILIKGLIFEQFGLTYLGPIDGHNISDMTNLLKEAKAINKPVLIHIVTKKGKGYAPAERQAENYHGISPSQHDDCFTKHTSAAMVQLGEKHKNVVAITAAMTSGTGLKSFEGRFKDRFFDVGISEEHAVTFAAGMALSGLKPYVCIYSTFLQRAYDQILHDVCLQNLPVVFCIDRAGLNPADGETHHGVYDISYLRNLPNIEIFTPCTYQQLEADLVYAYSAKNPVAIRYPSDEEFLVPNEGDVTKWVNVVKTNQASATILAVGSRMTKLATQVSKLKNVNVVSVTCVKPLDENVLKELNNIVTIEDGVKFGGFYSEILEYFADKNVKIMGFGYEKTMQHGDFFDILKDAGMTACDIANKIW